MYLKFFLQFYIIPTEDNSFEVENISCTFVACGNGERKSVNCQRLYMLGKGDERKPIFGIHRKSFQIFQRNHMLALCSLTNTPNTRHDTCMLAMCTSGYPYTMNHKE